MKKINITLMTLVLSLWAHLGWAQQELLSTKVQGDFSKHPVSDQMFKDAPVSTISLMAQPMAVPRPAKVLTPVIKVQSVHNESWVAFRLKWFDKEKSEAGPLGAFSDAAAIQLPMQSGDTPPPIFMGAKNAPVHILHWRAQYQRDAEKGKPTMKDLYPNLNTDIYPMEFKDSGNLKLSEEMRETYAHALAAGNPQSYAKTGLDEIVAEGFGTSSVVQGSDASAKAVWEKGEWTLTIVRPLKEATASKLDTAKPGFIAFAIWQGGQDEVGSRKSLTMSWVPLKWK
jgi:hypothetical protein